MNEKCHVFLAEEVALQDPDRGAAELMETRLLQAGEALALVRAGRMTDGQCALAILLCEPLLREKGYLGARPPAYRSRPPAGLAAGRGKLCRCP